ncbi:MAG: cohesin domain-containing protein [Pseudomonadota bacterium]
MKLKMLSALTGFLLFNLSFPISAATIYLEPSKNNVLVNELFTLDLKASGLKTAASPSLSIYDLDLAFDPTLLDFKNITFGDQLDLFGLGSFQSTRTPSFGLINIFELSFDLAEDLDNLQLGEFNIAQFTFTAIGTGSSDLLLSVNALGDSSGQPISADIVNSSINISPSAVPLPGTLSLMISGLIGIFLLRFKNNLLN